MSRFYCSPQEVKGNEIIITQKEELHHIIDVMRQGRGDKVVVFDGSGKQYRGYIKDISSHKLVVLIEEVTRSQEPAIAICLACAIPKNARFDYLIQKTTELGVDEIIPLITSRTVVRIDLKDKPKKISRWQKICREAAKQCARTRLPKVSDILSFKELAARVKEFDLALIPHLSQDRRDLHSLDLSNVKNILVIIGPEGDFTPEEIKLALSAGCLPVSLGRNVLRVDTAAIFSVGTLAYLTNKL